MVFTVQFDRRLRREVRKAHRFEANLVAGRAPKTTARVDKSTWTYPCNWGFTGSGSATMNQEPLVAAGTLATLARQHHAACTKVRATLLSFCHGLRPFGAIGPTLHHRGPALISRKRANYSDQTPAK